MRHGTRIVTLRISGTTWGRALRRLTAAGVAASLLAACGMGERRAAAERIIESWSGAQEQGTARFGLVARTTVLTGQQAAVPEAATAEVAVEGVADLGRDRFAVLATPAPGAGVEPIVVAAGTTLFARRATDPQAGRSSTTRRPWARLDFTAIDPDDVDTKLPALEAVARLRTANRALNPFMLLQLLEGALSGSVEEVGTEPVRGVGTTHYKLNVDWEKATQDDDEEVTEAIEAVLKTLFVRGVVLPAEVWLDDQGLPRRFVLTLRSSVERRRIAEQTLSFELFDFGAPVEIALPAADQVVRVSGMGSLAQAVGGDT